uniref:hypothetical protein n=1 Tax=Candidatus Thiodubiliella endoseptemdiera TaxID=2738886 RepID=UPI0034DFBA2D
MSELTERLALRLTFDELNNLQKMADNNFVSKSTMIRQLINEKISNTNANLNLKILVEILMILRHQIKDEELNDILALVDAFKQKHNII